MKLIISSPGNPALVFHPINSIQVPTKNGMIGIYPNHVPLLSALESGILKIFENGKEKPFAISGGALETDGYNISILTSMAEDVAEELEAISERKKAAQIAMEEAKKSGDMISMERIIEIEEEYQKDTAREQLAMGNHRG